MDGARLRNARLFGLKPKGSPGFYFSKNVPLVKAYENADVEYWIIHLKKK